MVYKTLTFRFTLFLGSATCVLNMFNILYTTTAATTTTFLFLFWNKYWSDNIKLNMDSVCTTTKRMSQFCILSRYRKTQWKLQKKVIKSTLFAYLCVFVPAVLLIVVTKCIEKAFLRFNKIVAQYAQQENWELIKLYYYY